MAIRIQNPFNTLTSGDSKLDFVQGRIKQALDVLCERIITQAFNTLAATVPAKPAFFSAVFTGLAAAGNKAVANAPAGAAVVMLVNLTDDAEARDKFASTISTQGQIVQISALNLSAKTFLLLTVKQ